MISDDKLNEGIRRIRDFTKDLHPDPIREVEQWCGEEWPRREYFYQMRFDWLMEASKLVRSAHNAGVCDLRQQGFPVHMGEGADESLLMNALADFMQCLAAGDDGKDGAIRLARALNFWVQSK